MGSGISMKVCMVTSSFPRYDGDSWGPFILNYCKTLQKLGIEMHVVAPLAKPCKKMEEEIEGVIIHRFNYWPLKSTQRLAYPPGIIPNIKNYSLAKFQIFPYIFACFSKVLETVKKHKIDLIHAQWAFPSGFVAVLTEKVLKIPFLVTTQGAEFFISKPTFIKKIIRYVLQKAECVMPVSYHMYKRAIVYGADKNSLFVIPNAVDTKTFSKSNNNGRSELGIDPDNYVILTVRRLVHEKKVDVLIQAFAKFAESKSKVNLVIIGDGPERKKLENLARKLDVADKAIFIGWIDNKNLPKYYNISDVYVLSTVQEGLSLSLLEAMSCGLPVICTNIVGNPEVVSDGKNGFLVPPNDPNAICERLGYLYDNPNLATEMGKKAAKFINQNYSLKVIGKRIKDVYEKVVNGYSQ